MLKHLDYHPAYLHPALYRDHAQSRLPSDTDTDMDTISVKDSLLRQPLLEKFLLQLLPERLTLGVHQTCRNLEYIRLRHSVDPAQDLDPSTSMLARKARTPSPQKMPHTVLLLLLSRDRGRNQP